MTMTQHSSLKTGSPDFFQRSLLSLSGTYFQSVFVFSTHEDTIQNLLRLCQTFHQDHCMSPGSFLRN